MSSLLSATANRNSHSQELTAALGFHLFRKLILSVSYGVCVIDVWVRAESPFGIQRTSSQQPAGSREQGVALLCGTLSGWRVEYSG
jgi:hypothetical protein